MLRLRPYKNCDAKDITKWIRNEYCYRQWSADRFQNYPYPLSAPQLNTYYQQFENDPTCWQMSAIDESGAMVGHFIMRFIDPKMQIVRLGFVIINDTLQGNGYGTEMLQLALTYSFEILKVTTVTLGVFTNNPKALACYQKLGFKELYTNDTAYLYKNEYWPCIEMEITKENYQNLF